MVPTTVSRGAVASTSTLRTSYPRSLRNSSRSLTSLPTAREGTTGPLALRPPDAGVGDGEPVGLLEGLPVGLLDGEPDCVAAGGRTARDDESSGSAIQPASSAPTSSSPAATSPQGPARATPRRTGLPAPTERATGSAVVAVGAVGEASASRNAISIWRPSAYRRAWSLAVARATTAASAGETSGARSRTGGTSSRRW